MTVSEVMKHFLKLCQSSRESWMIHSESIQIYEIPKALVTLIASWKVFDRASKVIPTWRKVVTFSSKRARIGLLPQQWLRVIYKVLWARVAGSRSLTSWSPNVPTCNSLVGKCSLRCFPICTTIVSSNTISWLKTLSGFTIARQISYSFKNLRCYN